MSSENLDKETFFNLLKELKEDILKTQLRAALSVTTELTELYWRIGVALENKVTHESWGAATIKRLSKDLASLFPKLSGFSDRNLFFMRQFAVAYPLGICETAVSLIPWGHNISIIQKVKDPATRLWYAQKTVENGWSRSVLHHWIDSELHKREARSLNNFQMTLPDTVSDLAEQILKDPYNFSFLGLDGKFREKELEEGLVQHIQKFLIELGHGFAFVGNQYRITVDERDYYIDMLFYHLKLRCYIVVEFKTTAFDPRDAGQMSFYLSAIDDLLRHESDNPTIGMLLCKTKNKMTFEYALRDNLKPIGIASYETKILDSLPEDLRSSLPTIEELEHEFTKQEELCSAK